MLRLLPLWYVSSREWFFRALRLTTNLSWSFVASGLSRFRSLAFPTTYTRPNFPPPCFEVSSNEPFYLGFAVRPPTLTFHTVKTGPVTFFTNSITGIATWYVSVTSSS